MIEKPFPDAEIDALARSIDERARAAYRRFLELLDRGVAPREAIAQVRDEFDQRYFEELAAAFSRILEATWTAAEIRKYQVSGVELSRVLYDHWDAVGREVTVIIREHAQGMHQARELAKALYDGYGFRDVEPLKVRAGNFRTLPKALRRLATEPAVRAAIMQAARRASEADLVTASLRSAYTQAFEAAISGAGRAQLEKLLRVAVYEKSRYFASRIARTELARVHSNAVAAEVMADPMTEVVQWRLSAAHPRDDICDVFAAVDRYGLGPGCYPKGQAPKPPAHPHCMCRIRTRPDLRAGDARERPDAEREYLRRLGVKEAARLLGSERRLQLVLGGESALEAWNRGQGDYAVPTLGQFVGGG